MATAGNAGWASDSFFMDDITAHDPNFSGFSWPSPSPPVQQHQHHQTLNAFAPAAAASSPNFGVEIDGSIGDCDVQKEPNSKKRSRSELCSASSSKACREKLRRDKLNDKFMELGSILDPGRTPKTDKAAILLDAIRIVTQLQGEAKKLKDSNSSLQEKIKELKAEKNELRDEKQRLKAEKEKLEQQLKAMNSQPSFMPAPPAIPAAFTTQGQAPGNKLMPFISYPGVAMWQFMPPAAVDTSQDHVLRPPVA
ncbi:BHLH TRANSCRIPTION FACTOR [Salix purpurea]|uniref:BHLH TRANSCRIPTION FACTOR n=1 Tax=Salix purpurea TaxID=77065 RepID=A0A9Q0WRR7_SALPP|nr:BHLH TRANSCRIPTION FACTOR [Salix purpurea]